MEYPYLNVRMNRAGKYLRQCTPLSSMFSWVSDGTTFTVLHNAQNRFYVQLRDPTNSSIVFRSPCSHFICTNVQYMDNPHDPYPDKILPIKTINICSNLIVLKFVIGKHVKKYCLGGLGSCLLWKFPKLVKKIEWHKIKKNEFDSWLMARIKSRENNGHRQYKVLIVF